MQWKDNIRVIISGGGTGGHIFPAIAIANAIKKECTSSQFLFIGALGRMEMEKVPAAGYQIAGLPIAGLQRKFSVSNFALPFKIVSSVAKAIKLIRTFKPDVVIGVGGYASGPLLFAATLLNKPTLIQEQNSYAGVTNKILAKRVNKVCVAYEGMEKYFPANKIVITGNPVRKDVIGQNILRSEALAFFGLKEDKKTLLVFGGSLGSRTLNESIKQQLKEIKHADIQLIWQTGKSWYPSCHLAANDYKDKIKVFEFINRMDMAYAAADVVVSRAGAISISELCIVKKPALLVPSPNVAEDHQTKNAMALVNKNAAVIITDVEAREKLVAASIALLNNPEEQKKLSENIGAMAMPNADYKIVEQINSLLQ